MYTYISVLHIHVMILLKTPKCTTRAPPRCWDQTLLSCVCFCWATGYFPNMTLALGWWNVAGSMAWLTQTWFAWSLLESPATWRNGELPLWFACFSCSTLLLLVSIKGNLDSHWTTTKTILGYHRIIHTSSITHTTTTPIWTSLPTLEPNAGRNWRNCWRAPIRSWPCRTDWFEAWQKLGLERNQESHCENTCKRIKVHLRYRVPW